MTALLWLPQAWPLGRPAFEGTQAWHLARAAVVGLAVMLSAACGGGVKQAEAFVPGRVLVFGDESSLLLPSGQRWGINGLDPSTGRLDCQLQPVWVQSVAADYGLVFEACNTGSPPSEPRALMFAEVHARVAEVSDQIAALNTFSSVRSNDLALVMAGSNDVWELYGQYPTRGEAALLADIRNRADRLAALINNLVARGAKVVVVNLPDLGLSPEARAERELHAETGFDRAALITRLALSFNERLGTKLLLDGRYIGLVQLDERSQAIDRSPGSFGFTDVVSSACRISLPECTTATLHEGASESTFLWSDGRHFSPAGQAQIASLALARTRGNPF